MSASSERKISSRRDARECSAEILRRRLLVVPEARRLHLPLEGGDRLLEVSGVKGSPRAASAGRGGHWR